MTQPTIPIEDSTVEQVVAFVREGIIGGNFRPGAKLLPKQTSKTST